MKRLFIWFVPFIFLIALCMYFFSPLEKYDFMVQITKISQLEFTNPLENFADIIEAFQGFGNISFGGSDNWFLDAWNAVGQFFTLIWDILKAPILMVYDIVCDIAVGGRAVFILLGFE